ncbi:hypothetical protein [Microbacterium sediminis]|uniref:Uncharacterized protein n=1 Tax=Microbacterium sediminis TaxID=904291 RepID=A0A1B9NCH4_9MICO|nr:hypothetical protein [Microbacterium sediminis]OCG74299.1 hypothetical protein A7J15_05525 [Microbacterium sediminis]QBR73663.1 hypothetical protein E3O41_04000 [Microbacterium sediminis]
MPRKTISSNPTFRAGLLWTTVAGAVVLVAAAVVGLIVDGSQGLWSGVLGALIGALFPIITVASMLFGNRWYGTPQFLQMFFGITMGVFIVKVVVFLVAIAVVLGLPWVNLIVFYVALVAAAVASLVIDVIIVTRMRISGASDVALPGDDEESPRP